MSGRVLTCQSCGEDVRVYELPRPFIDPLLYVCSDCHVPVREEEQGEQLSLPEVQREETRNYDPTIAEIPF